MPESTKEGIARRLAAAGKRLTPERELLLRIIDGNAHLDAAEIYRIARSENPHIGIATVYRTLHLLRDLGLVRSIGLGEGHRHYELRRGDHVHLICSRCGRVIEIPAPTGLQGLGKSEGFEVHQTRFEAIGYCKECLAELESLHREKEGEDATH